MGSPVDSTDRGFRSTLWSVIHGAARGDKAAQEEFIKTYLPAVRGWLRHRLPGKFTREDIQDFTQEVFMEIFKKNILAKVSESKGKFRTYLIRVARNVVGACIAKLKTQKKGGDLKVVSLEQVQEEIDQIASHEDDGDISDIWNHFIFEESMKRVRRSLHSPIDKRNFVIFTLYLQRWSHQEISDTMGVTVDVSRNAVRNFRRIFKETASELIWNQCYSKEEYESQWKEFLRYLEEEQGEE